MRAPKSARWVLVVVSSTVLALSGAASQAEAVPCGPGVDWVDNCPGGTDRFHSQAQHGIVIFDQEDGGFVVNLPLMTGKTTVLRGPGTAGSNIPGGSHHIDTEMVSLSLSGGGLVLKAGDKIANLSSDGTLFSPGRIDETANPLIAHSFFDVFFELTPTPFGTLHNNAPCRMEADIDQVPPFPGTGYLCTTVPVDLFDAGGVHRAILTGAVTHTVLEDRVPEPSTLFLLGSGLAALGVMARRARRK